MSSSISSKLMLEMVLDTLPVRIFWKDTDLSYLGCNQHFCEDAGAASPEEMIGRSDYDYYESDVAELYRADDREVIDSGITKIGYEEPQTNLDGKTRWLKTSKIPLKDNSGNIVGVLGTYEDITEQKLLSQRIERMALEDDLTKLPNRAQFRLSLEEAISESALCEGILGLVVLDLDNFKHINDTLGHLVGDQLLQNVSQRIKDYLPEGAMVARLGGDEFAVILREQESLEQIEGFVGGLFGELNRPFVVEDNIIHVGASFGLTSYLIGDTDTHELLRNADIALYEAKTRGKAQFCVFNNQMDERLREIQKIENGLHYALANDEFYVLYQPQICLTTGRIIGAETLLRWEHPQWGLIPPNKFINIAETKSVISEIGDFTVREACVFSSEMLSKFGKEISVSVNLSLNQFRSSDLVESVRNEIARTSIKPKLFELEITEGVALGTGDDAVRILNALKGLGIELAIDDFGTGYSSLIRLKEFPVDRLKIDKSFISSVDRQWSDAAITRAIVKLGDSLGLQVIAEGVETQSQLRAIYDMGCRQVQGFFFSKPLSPVAFRDFALNHDPARVLDYFNKSSRQAFAKTG